MLTESYIQRTGLYIQEERLNFFLARFQKNRNSEKHIKCYCSVAFCTERSKKGCSNSVYIRALFTAYYVTMHGLNPNAILHTHTRINLKQHSNRAHLRLIEALGINVDPLGLQWIKDFIHLDQCFSNSETFCALQLTRIPQSTWLAGKQLRVELYPP